MRHHRTIAVLAAASILGASASASASARARASASACGDDGDDGDNAATADDADTTVETMASVPPTTHSGTHPDPVDTSTPARPARSTTGC